MCYKTLSCLTVLLLQPQVCMPPVASLVPQQPLAAAAASAHAVFAANSSQHHQQQQPLGQQLLQQQQVFDMAGALAWTLQLVVFVLVVQAILTLIESIAFRYRAVSERTL